MQPYKVGNYFYTHFVDESEETLCELPTVTQLAQEGWEELLHVQGRWDGCEEIALVQGKEQWLRFAGALWRDTPRPR